MTIHGLARPALADARMDGAVAQTLCA
jgi:hypothetical protein